MKINIPFGLAAVCVLVCLACDISRAAPVPNSNLGREYLIGSSGLDLWSCGLFFKSGERGIEWENGSEAALDSTKLMAVVGYDIFRWITPYATIGWNDTDIGNVESDGSSAEFGGGLHFNLIDQEILDPTLLEDRLRLNANVYYSMTSADYLGNDQKWSELSASLTVGIVNDIIGDKYFFPEGICLFAGPMFSVISGDDFEEEENFGFVAGLEFYLTKRVSFDVSAEVFDEPALTGALNVRF